MQLRHLFYARSDEAEKIRAALPKLAEDLHPARVVTAGDLAEPAVEKHCSRRAETTLNTYPNAQDAQKCPET